MTRRPIAYLAPLAVVATALLLPGCGSVNSAVQIGSAPDATPPRITRTYTSAWDRPGAFGPVPADMKARGDGFCSALGKDYKAVGYHKLALDDQGKTFPDGGYFCSNDGGAGPAGAAPDATPPRITRTYTSAWDRPSAFGPVPAAVKGKGDAFCSALGKDYKAIGYHALAQDENGKVFPDGGFFCSN
jgi:hypothetical protein